MITNIKGNRLILILFLFFSITSFSQVRLPKLASDGMVLQRNTPIKIWGWASEGEKISVIFHDSIYRTQADTNGNWNVFLPSMKAGGPYQMKINGTNSISVNDIMIGEVWLCSGQSNMELTMLRVSPLYGDEIANSENSDIRYFQIPDKYNFNNPQKDFTSGSWEKANPKNVLSFSAVSYFFGKELYDKYKVPIGLINSALGGSPAEAWISKQGLREFPKYFQIAIRFQDSTLIQRIKKSDTERISGWYNELREKDKGYQSSEQYWYNPNYIPDGWSTMQIPGYWNDDNSELKNGAVWFRKEFKVPASMIGKEAKLNLGRIVDADSTFINGVFVGNTTYQYPPRRYTIPANVLKEGKNIIVVRIVSNSGKGGFVEDKPYEITVDNKRIDLSGEWQYKLGAKMEPLKSQIFIRWKPLGLYNAMIAPLLNYKIKGVIWYQGESNTGNPIEYRKLFPALIKDWRFHFDQDELPFLFVQLPNFMRAKQAPSESNWALLREAQLKTLSIPNTGMVVAIDIGEWNDIHPLNKEDVGKRLALAARKVAYHENDIVYSGPIYQSMKIDGNKAILSFSHTGSGLVAKDNSELKGFAIAGPDSNFVWAKAEIKDGKVIVWSDEISIPIAVRYAWADNPENANLFNKEGLPASPFRTDEW